MNRSPLIFNLQRFCLHDGPGIRTTVFFKGCPLRCHWCHNPESQDFQAELLFDREKCVACQRCLTACPAKAIQHDIQGLSLDRTRCSACGQCADLCLGDARTLSGHKRYTLPELLCELEKDRVFYEESGGGVTFSGGEALCQAEAVENLARSCKERGLHVALDTCGHVPFSAFERLLPWTDLFLYDIKHHNSQQHLRHTGQENTLILDNLKKLAAAGAEIFLRLPLIEGINAADTDIEAYIHLLNPLPPRRLFLLPYHAAGVSKWQRLGRKERPALAAPSAERLDTIQRRFAAAGFTVQIGG